MGDWQLFRSKRSTCKVVRKFTSIARTAEGYHQQTRKQAQKQPKFKISDMVAKVDKINPFHPNMLLGQITEIEESGYVRIVTEYGKVTL